MTVTPPSSAPAPRSPRTQRPESVAYMLWLWMGALCGEAVHQVLNVVLTLLNHDVLMSQAKEMAKSAPAGVDEAQLSDAFLRTAAYASVALSAAISLAIIVLLAFLGASRQAGRYLAARVVRFLAVFWLPHPADLHGYPGRR